MDLSGKRVTVMGLGRFGGGVGVARYLVKQGADVLVTDLAPRKKLADSLAELDGLPIEYRLGEHNVSDFTTCDMVVANPAVKPDNRFLRAAQAAGIPITSEIRLLVAALPNRLRTIGVTGTAGKSTVTAMIGHILRKTLGENRVYVGGNLGGSLLEHLDDIGSDDWVVLELSSFMLHGLREDKWSPHIAVITNVSPNHLDWHGSFDAYVADKQVILDYQKSAHLDQSVLGPGVGEYVESKSSHGANPPVEAYDDKALNFISIPGHHNKINALLAAIACNSYIPTGHCSGSRWLNENFDSGVMIAIDCLADFSGLPHRLQFVGEHNGVRYFNDSKCTTPEAAKLAIKSFDPGTVHIILGGYDKGSDLTPLAGFAAERCAGVYTIGDTGEGIRTAAEAASADSEVVRCEELEAAVREAVKRAKPGQVVLLSPACASWDQFENYEQRGDRFIKLVNSTVE